MDGWLLEMWFFANLENKEVKVYDYNGIELEPFAKKNIELFDPNEMTLETIKNLPKYLKTKKWNQGGYDLIYINDNNDIEFVQITRGLTHSLKLKYFAQFLENLKNIPNSTFKAKDIDILFIVPKGNGKTFKINKGNRSRFLGTISF